MYSFACGRPGCLQAFFVNYNRDLLKEGEMRKPLKLWEKTARTLARMVASGHWAVGSIIPPEIELAKTY